MDTLTVSGPSITDLEVTVDVTHTFIGDLDIFVTSPSGATAQLHDNSGGGGMGISVVYSTNGVPNGMGGYNCACAMQPEPNSLELMIFNGEQCLGDWILTITDSFGGDDGTLNAWCIECRNMILRGDCNGDGIVNAIVDALYLLDFGFLSGPPPPCEAQADANGDRIVDPLSDAFYLLIFGFSGGSAPPAPFPNCGTDHNGVSALGCDDSPCP